MLRHHEGTRLPHLDTDQQKIRLSGRLSMDMLFAGSKSEGLYPVLHAEDGRAYRAHVKGELALNEKTLRRHADQEVTLFGVVDDLRGHWRITLDPSDQDMICLPAAGHDGPQDSGRDAVNATIALNDADMGKEQDPPDASGAQQPNASDVADVDRGADPSGEGAHE